jgi:hypothetical protein
MTDIPTGRKVGSLFIEVSPTTVTMEGLSQDGQKREKLIHIGPKDQKARVEALAVEHFMSQLRETREGAGQGKMLTGREVLILVTGNWPEAIHEAQAALQSHFLNLAEASAPENLDRQELLTKAIERVAGNATLHPQSILREASVFAQALLATPEVRYILGLAAEVIVKE